jgi:hypothetical protein
VSATQCAVTEAHAEVVVVCTMGRGCAATRVHRSQVDTNPKLDMPLDYATRHDVVSLLPPRMGLTDGR